MDDGGDVMKYMNTFTAQFERRLNRFIAEVFIDGVAEQVHVKNTGRLKELLKPGVQVVLEKSDNPNRKTKYSLIAVDKEGEWVNIDSQAPNKVAYEALDAGLISEFGPLDNMKQEVTYGGSRFDVYVENKLEKGFIEVKGVTLEKNGVAMFPDAPTSRGTKHVLELIKAREEGYSATVLFIIQMKGCHKFAPNQAMDQAFTDALVQASRAGVQILAYDSIVKKDELVLDQAVPVTLP